MGTRRNTSIVTQHPAWLSAPTRAETLWRGVHRTDAWRRQGGRCCYCCEPLAMARVTADHVEPRRRGGGTSSRNIAAACRPCNSAKGHMPEKAFKRAIRRPEPQHKLSIWLAHARRRIWLRTMAAERRLLALVGLEEAA
jgi:5-methylcytosine-specific restriction endonuclease McrA